MRRVIRAWARHVRSERKVVRLRLRRSLAQWRRFRARQTAAKRALGAVVLAITYIGGENAQILLKLPKNVTGIFQGMLLFFLLACDTLIRYRLRFSATRKAPS